MKKTEREERIMSGSTYIQNVKKKRNDISCPRTIVGQFKNIYGKRNIRSEEGGSRKVKRRKKERRARNQCQQGEA